MKWPQKYKPWLGQLPSQEEEVGCNTTAAVAATAFISRAEVISISSSLRRARLKAKSGAPMTSPAI